MHDWLLRWLGRVFPNIFTLLVFTFCWRGLQRTRANIYYIISSLIATYYKVHIRCLSSWIDSPTVFSSSDDWQQWWSVPYTLVEPVEDIYAWIITQVDGLYRNDKVPPYTLKYMIDCRGGWGGVSQLSSHCLFSPSAGVAFNEPGLISIISYPHWSLHTIRCTSAACHHG